MRVALSNGRPTHGRVGSGVGTAPAVEPLLEIIHQRSLDVGQLTQGVEHFADVGRLTRFGLFVGNTGEDLRRAVKPAGLTVLRFGMREQVESERDERVERFGSMHSRLSACAKVA